MKLLKSRLHDQGYLYITSNLEPTYKGNKYIGEWLNGKPHGSGKFIIYEGGQKLIYETFNGEIKN